MINQLLLISFTIFVYEFVKFINLIKIIRANLGIYKKIIKLFTSKVSDLRKEKLIIYYSKTLFIVSIKIMFIIACILVSIFSLNLLSNSFIEFIISLFGIIELTLVSIIYHQLRKKISENI